MNFKCPLRTQADKDCADDLAKANKRVKFLETANFACQKTIEKSGEMYATLLDKNGVLIRTLAPLLPPPPPTQQWDVSAAQLRARLVEITGPNVSIDLADAKYKIATVTEFIRFMAHIKAWEMEWKEDAPDCDDFTRYAKGRLVCPGWWWQPPLDVWFTFKSGGGHSELMTLLADDRDGPLSNSINASMVAELFLIEFQAQELIQLAREYFDDSTGHRIWNVNH